jgi:hypothetical protein
MSDNKKQKHLCPKLPEGLDKVTPQGWSGESAETARRMWFAWLRIVDKQRPLARNTNGPR